jgi:hypothetical protein
MYVFYSALYLRDVWCSSDEQTSVLPGFEPVNGLDARPPANVHLVCEKPELN